MKIDYSNVPDLYPASKVAVMKGQDKIFCPCCRKTLDVKNFFKTNRVDKHPSGYLPECKTCVSMTIDDTDPSTFLSLLKEIDIPYMPTVWRELVVKKDPKAGSIIGKYVSKARLNQYKRYRWADTQSLVDKETDSLLEALRQTSDSESEAEKQVEAIMNFTDIPSQKAPMNVDDGPSMSAGMYQLIGLTPETSKYHLTQKEIDELKVTWGRDYSEDDYMALEQQFHDMQSSYVINDPIAISNAKIICKMTLKMNKFLDIDDVESVSKISRQLDLFIKSANLAPVQQKDRQSSTFAISQLAFMIEKEGGFIPQWDTSEPMDNIDMILKDMQDYTNSLVLGESNINEMAKNTAAILAQNDLPEAKVEDYSEFAALEAEVLGDIQEVEENATTD